METQTHFAGRYLPAHILASLFLWFLIYLTIKRFM